MCIDKSYFSKARELFKEYGYTELNTQYDDCLVFLLDGMYPCIELISSESGEKRAESLKKDYKEMDYAVKIFSNSSIDELEKYLFNGFFKVKAANRRISRMYEEYTSSVMKPYGKQGSDYEYIDVSYTVEHGMEKTESKTGGIVDSIYDNMKGDEPKLIIVEAAAGYGKTSTAYEVLHKYANIEMDIRPIFMKLEKDRSANTFRYLLLSHIDRDFDIQLKNDIVIKNIKNGRIPLIIDGFDELLSKDLDEGKQDTAFGEVETMLSTIADLLTNRAKVVLTSRKTAIFSGPSFAEWYNNQKEAHSTFSLIRYQLDSPTIEQWLPNGRKQKLPFADSSSVSNPVLLSYLRYCDDKDFKKSVKTPDELIDNFFSFMLRREMERQNLPLSPSEQRRIFSHLACIFGGYGITADTRSRVKEQIGEIAYGVIANYASSSQDIDNITNSLTNHALLDRKGFSNVGFINDFIFGLLLKDSIVEDGTDLMYHDFHQSTPNSYLAKAILASSILGEDTKSSFWECLKKECKLNSEEQFWADILLKGETKHELSSLYISDCTLANKFLGNSEEPLNQCTFANVKFSNCVFDEAGLHRCYFISCTFDNCQSINEDLALIFMDCEFYNCDSWIKGYPHDDATEDICLPDNEKEESLEVKILRKYLKVDNRNRRMKMISKVREEFLDNPKEFHKCFERLVSKKLLCCNGDKSFLTDEGFTYITSKL